MLRHVCMPPPTSLASDSLLAKRVAIVTGAASGIGRACAIALASAGADVSVADLDLAGAQETVRRIEAAGGRALALEVDVSDEDAVASMVARSVEAFGGLDILHNNAAMLAPLSESRDAMVAELVTENWDRAFAVNLRGVMLGCKHAIPAMLTRGGGSIINTSSGSSLGGDWVNAAYAASKAGVNSLTQTVATQYGKLGIRCNAILPGLIVTEAAERSLPEETRAMLLEHHLTPRVGTPQDIANMVVYLASDLASFVTGQLLSVDGGIGSHLPTYADSARQLGGR